MTSLTTIEGDERVTILCVDDDPGLLKVVATFLEREVDRFDVVTETSAEAGLATLDGGHVDCVVSDYQMPEMDGLEFLDAVRESDPDLPFVLYTGEGSEAIAGEAISRGVTDYLQKGSSSEKYTVLANRVENAVDRHRSQQLIEAREERFHALLEHSTDLIAILDRSGTYRYQSPSSERILGYEPDELVGESAFDFIHPDDHERVSAEFERAIEDPEVTPTVEYRFRHSDGSWRWLESIGTNQLETPAVGGFVINSRDVTERRERERQLQRERDRFETLFESIPEPIVCGEVDEEGRFVVQNVNEAFETTFGCEAADAIGREVNDIVVPDDPELRAEAESIDERAASGERLVQAVRRQGADGMRDFLFRSAPVEHDGEIVQQFGVYVDVTERKRHERRLEQFQQRSQALIDAETTDEITGVAIDIAEDVLDLPLSGIHLLDEDGGTLVPVSVTAVVGEQFEEVPRYLRHGEGGAADAVVSRVFETGEPFVCDDTHESEVLGKRRRPARSTIIQPLGNHGVFIASSPEPDAIDHSSRVLTDVLASTVTATLNRVDREQRLHERERELEQQNERLDEFSRMVTHDLRNPIQVASAELELARLEDDLESDHVVEIENALERMTAIVEDTLTLAREGRTVGEVDPVSLPELAERCWRTVDTASAHLEVDDVTITANPDRLRNVFENLFRNAVEHAGGRTTVRVGRLDDGFYVEDDGPGIPAEEREMVFDPSYTSDQGGLGIGLSIVEEVVEAHGWNVRITEGDTGGARFEITGVEVVA